MQRLGEGTDICVQKLMSAGLKIYDHRVEMSGATWRRGLFTRNGRIRIGPRLTLGARLSPPPRLVAPVTSSGSWPVRQ
jgi:hypothetical protein